LNSNRILCQSGMYYRVIYMFYRARGDIILELIGIKPTPGER